MSASTGALRACIRLALRLSHVAQRGHPLSRSLADGPTYAADACANTCANGSDGCAHGHAHSSGDRSPDQHLCERHALL